MKALGLFTNVVCSILLFGCAATAPMTSASLDAQAKTLTPETGRANVYVARPGTFVGAALAVQTLLDDRPAGSLAPGTYQLLSVAPGKHVISTILEAPAGQRTGSPVILGPERAFGYVTAEAGKNYFFELSLGSGLNPEQLRSTLQLISEQAGREVILRLKRAEAIQ